MQSNVTDILNAAGQVDDFQQATARNFKETDTFPALLVGKRSFEETEPKNLQTTIYDGYWAYPVYIYVEANAGDHDDYSDFEQAEDLAKQFLTELLDDAEWELDEGIDQYEGTLAGREVVVAQVNVKRFTTERYKP